MVTELTKGVYWVGVVDWSIRKFHGHELSTHRGTTYNSYLVVDEKVALIDTVWGIYSEELLNNIREIIDPSKIDIVVASHGETDHSGALPAVMAQCPNAELVVSKRGAESIEGHYHQGWNYSIKRTGDKMDLGNSKLVFINAPMLHWPDSMFVYVEGRNFLFPNDAFGQHYATAFRFNDQVDQHELYEEAQKYYANILTPFSRQVAKKIDELVDMNLSVDVIGPSHGVIWRDNPMQIVEQYQEWSAQEPAETAVILYDTMWEGTRLMAEAIGEGLAEKDIPYKIFHMAITDRNDVIAEIFKSKAVIVGSPTLNNGLLPGITPILEDMKGQKFANKIGAAFGSYGWSGESVKQLEQHLEACKIEIVAEGVRAKWQPNNDDVESCKELGRQVAASIKNG